MRAEPGHRCSPFSITQEHQRDPGAEVLTWFHILVSPPLDQDPSCSVHNNPVRKEGAFSSALSFSDWGPAVITNTHGGAHKGDLQTCLDADFLSSSHKLPEEEMYGFLLSLNFLLWVS